MSQDIISFFDCTPELQGPQLVIPAAVPKEQAVVSVLSDWSDLSDSSDKVAGYRISRHFRGWITVTAEFVRRTVARTVCTRSRNIVRMSGVQILRQCMILRF